MVQLDHRSHSVVSVLLQSATNGQHVIEAKTDFLLPKPQHRLEIIRRQSDIDDTLANCIGTTLVRPAKLGPALRSALRIYRPEDQTAITPTFAALSAISRRGGRRRFWKNEALMMARTSEANTINAVRDRSSRS
jgi:hypothetical protein